MVVSICQLLATTHKVVFPRILNFSFSSTKCGRTMRPNPHRWDAKPNLSTCFFFLFWYDTFCDRREVEVAAKSEALWLTFVKVAVKEIDLKSWWGLTGRKGIYAEKQGHERQSFLICWWDVFRRVSRLHRNKIHSTPTTQISVFLNVGMLCWNAVYVMSMKIFISTYIKTILNI